MKIENMKINAYGKLHNIEINLDNRINIIHGNNESGKSTILKYIINSFYGTSKNKKGKDISDFEKFKPWEGEEFSGKLKYRLDNGKAFEIYREFNKKNPKIFNENLEDVSRQFNIDKNRGNEFFYDQTKIDEELFLSTSAILQQEVIIEKNKQTTLIQKMANLVGTGDDNVSYKRAMERLTRRQLDEVGTDRSREKPINKISKKIKETNEEISKLEKYEEQNYEIENNKKEVINKIKNEEIEYNFLNEIKKINDKKEIETEKIKLKEKIKEDNYKKIKLLKKEIETVNLQKQKEEKRINEKNNAIRKKSKIGNVMLIVILAIVNIVQFLFLKNYILNLAIFLLSVIGLGAFWNISKLKLNQIIENKSRITENNHEILKLQSELDILEQNSKNIEFELEKLKNEINNKYDLEIEEIKNNYIKKIENENYEIFISKNLKDNSENNFENKYENLNEKNKNYNLIELKENKNNNSEKIKLYEIEKELLKLISEKNIDSSLEKLQKNINNDKIKLQTMNIIKDDIEKKLEKKSYLEEQLSLFSEQYVNLQKLNLSMNLAKEILDSCYEKMKESVTPKFTEQLSKTICKITNRKI